MIQYATNNSIDCIGKAMASVKPMSKRRTQGFTPMPHGTNFNSCQYKFQAVFMHFTLPKSVI